MDLKKEVGMYLHLDITEIGSLFVSIVGLFVWLPFIIYIFWKYGTDFLAIFFGRRKIVHIFVILTTIIHGYYLFDLIFTIPSQTIDIQNYRNLVTREKYMKSKLSEEEKALFIKRFRKELNEVLIRIEVRKRKTHYRALLPKLQSKGDKNDY
ncbi:hypothetical protein ACFLY7_01630 [Patescibacteria group bacterium]